MGYHYSTHTLSASRPELVRCCIAIFEFLSYHLGVTMSFCRFGPILSGKGKSAGIGHRVCQVGDPSKIKIDCENRVKSAAQTGHHTETTFYVKRSREIELACFPCRERDTTRVLMNDTPSSAVHQFRTVKRCCSYQSTFSAQKIQARSTPLRSVRKNIRVTRSIINYLGLLLLRPYGLGSRRANPK